MAIARRPPYVVVGAVHSPGPRLHGQPQDDVAKPVIRVVLNLKRLSPQVEVFPVAWQRWPFCPLLGLGQTGARCA
eukprot:6694171-Alexandrium_andersonii.AAC.1